MNDEFDVNAMGLTFSQPIRNLMTRLGLDCCSRCGRSGVAGALRLTIDGQAIDGEMVVMVLLCRKCEFKARTKGFRALIEWEGD